MPGKEQRLRWNDKKFYVNLLLRFYVYKKIYTLAPAGVISL